MKAKDLRQNGFSKYYPPSFYHQPPLEFYITKKEISRVKLNDEAHIDFDPTKKYFISLGLDYGYYPGDTEPEAYLVEYEEIKTLNKSYTRQLQEFLITEHKHKQDVEAWEAWKKALDEEEIKKKEVEERKQYLQLKKKYEQ